MNANTQKFETTKGLLRDVMEKQAGTPQKAILEGVMNSVDANARNISISIQKEGITIEDDGEGMSEEDIDKYFRQFGLKDDDIEDKEFGQFRMGRGQLFSFGANFWHTKNNVLVVNIQEDQTTVEMDGETKTVEQDGLSFTTLETDDYHDGCSIGVELYEELDHVPTVVEDTKELIKYVPWLHDVSIEINGEDFRPSPSVERETEVAYYIRNTNRHSSQTKVYNQGAFVKKENLGPLGLEIISKQEVDVNFARNEILENCPVYSQIEEEYRSATIEYLLDSENLTISQRKWLLTEAVKDTDLREVIKDRPIISDVSNEEHTVEQLEGEKITFGSAYNDMAKKAAEKTSFIVVNDSYEKALKSLLTTSTIKPLGETFSNEKSYEMSEIDRNDLSKKRERRLTTIKRFLDRLGYSGTVKAGYSSHVTAWKDEDETLFVHKDALNTKKQEFGMEVLHTVVKVAAHSGDTRDGFDEDYSFKNSYYSLMSGYSEAQKDFFNGEL